MNLNKIVITLILIFETFTIVGQSIMTSSATVVGKNLITNKEIKATKYEFRDRVYKSRLDTTSHTLTLQLRGIKNNGKYYNNTGELAVLDLRSKEIKWSKEINYRTTEIEQYEGVLFLNKGLGATTRIELTTGDNQWSSKVVVFATVPNLNIALGYKYNSFLQELSTNLSCIDLKTGKVLWERSIDRSYGWNGIENLNDTALIIKSSGLHQVNIKTGKGWDYDAKTGLKNYSKTVGANVAGAVIGFLTGSFVVSSGHDLVSNLVSNLAADSLGFYFASKDYLACLSHDGTVRWKVALPKETSCSNLLFDTARVYLINEGEAEYNGKKYNYGKPFIAAFDKKTGAQEYLSKFDLVENPLLEFITGKDSIDLLFKDRAIRFSKKDGFYNTMSFDLDQIGSFDYAVGMFRTYIKSDSIFQSLHSLDPRAIYMKSTKERVVKLNQNLGFDRDFGLDELYLWRADSKKYTFLYSDNNVFVVNRFNRAIAKLNIGKKIFVFDDKLYGMDSNTIIEIDLDEELS